MVACECANIVNHGFETCGSIVARRIDGTYWSCTSCVKSCWKTITEDWPIEKFSKNRCLYGDCTNMAMWGHGNGTSIKYCTGCAKKSGETGLVNSNLGNANKPCPGVDKNGKVCGKKGAYDRNGFKYCARHGKALGLEDTDSKKCTVCKETIPTFKLFGNKDTIGATHCLGCAKASGKRFRSIKRKCIY